MATKNAKNTEATTEDQGQMLFAHAVKQVGRKSYWTRIGVAFPHKDGGGFNLQLEAFPIDGKVVLRNRREDEEQETTGEAA